VVAEILAVAAAISKQAMKIAAIADTHGIPFEIPEAEVFIHGGDMTGWGNWAETAALGKHLGEEVSGHVLLIPGNHDNAFEEFPRAEMYPFQPCVHLLIDQVWEYKGLVFYGSPWTNLFENVNPRCRAFMRTEDDLRRCFLKMPAEIDVLVTHSPPRGILDDGKGSIALREAIKRRKIRRHLFGHIHECGGRSHIETQSEGAGREFYNISAIAMKPREGFRNRIRTYCGPPLQLEF
jgi:Icc-related predicted phosphoesterase